MNNKFKKNAVSLLLASTLALTGCQGSTKEDTSERSIGETITISDVEVKEDGIKEVVIGNKIVSVSDLKLVDNNNKVIDKVDAVLIGNKLINIKNLQFIKYNSDIEYVVLNNELIPVNSLKLVNTKTNEEVKEIDYAVINNELVPFENVIIGSKSNNSKNDAKNEEKIGFNYDGSAAITNHENYKELTTERFEELVAKNIKYFESLGIQVKREDVIKFIMVFNIDKLEQDNRQLVRTIIGDQEVEEVFFDAFKVSDVLRDYEFQNLIYDGKAFDYSGCFFDEEQSEIVKHFQERKLEIIKADQSNREKMTEQLLYDIKDSKSEFRKLEEGPLYLMLANGVLPIDWVYFKDVAFNSTLTGNARMYMFEYIAPYGATEEQMQNSVMSGTYRTMIALVGRCLENSKTYTR